MTGGQDQAVHDLAAKIHELCELAESMFLDDRCVSDDAFATETRRLRAAALAARDEQRRIVNQNLGDANMELSAFVEELGGHVDMVRNVVNGIDTTTSLLATVERILSFFSPFGFLTQH